MAALLGEAYVEISGRDVGLKKVLSKAEADTRDFAVRTGHAMKQGLTEELAGATSGPLKGFITSFGRQLAAGAVIGVSAAAGYSVKAALDASRGQAELASALEATGEASTANIGLLNQYAESIQELTVYSKEAVVAGMALASGMGVASGDLAKASEAAVGLATRFNIDLSAAFRYVSDAMGGNTEALTRYIPALKNIKDPVARLKVVLAEGATGFKQATKEAQTSWGQFEQFKNSVQSAAIALGNALLPAIQGFIALAKPFVDILAAIPAPILAAVGAILGIGAGVIAVVTAIALIARAWDTVTKSALGAAIAQWQATHPLATTAMRMAAVAAAIGLVVAAVVGVGKATAGTTDELDKLKAQIESAMSHAKDSMGKAESQAGNLSKAIVTPDLAAQLKAENDRYMQQAEAIWDVYQNLLKAREEEERRLAMGVGWAALRDVWRGAAVAGAKFRFPPEPVARQLYGAAYARGGAAGEIRIEPGLFREAVRIWADMHLTQRAMLEMLRLQARALQSQAVYLE